MRAGTAARVLAGVAGVAMFAVPARYAVVRSLDVRPAVWVRWRVTAAVVHDVVVAPVAVAVGWAVVRFAPRWLKAPLQSALLLSAVVVAVSWPALRGYGRVASNPTYLPRDYARGLTVTLAVVWIACGGWVVGRLIRRRSAPGPARNGAPCRAGTGRRRRSGRSALG